MIDASEDVDSHLCTEKFIKMAQGAGVTKEGIEEAILCNPVRSGDDHFCYAG